jgi:hypothetical protein
MMAQMSLVNRRILTIRTMRAAMHQRRSEKGCVVKMVVLPPEPGLSAQC